MFLHQKQLFTVTKKAIMRNFYRFLLVSQMKKKHDSIFRIFSNFSKLEHRKYLSGFHQ